VEAFGLVSRIAEKRLEALLFQGGQEGLFVFDGVGAGAAVDDCPEDQMVGRVADSRELGISVFVVSAVPAAALRVVGRDVTCLQSRRVDGRQLRASLEQLGLAAQGQRRGLQTIGEGLGQQPPGKAW
jgi:hypothetical protein